MSGVSPSTISTSARGPAYPIRSVDTALQLLLLFGEHREISVSQAGELLGVAPSTAHRMLSMLQHRNFVSQNERTKAYYAGPALVQTGLAAIHMTNLRQEIHPHLELLVREIGETAHLQIRQGRNVIFFDGEESSFALRAAHRTGDVLPANCTAGGKALLAQLSDEDLSALFADAVLEGLTAHSIISRDDLKAELAEVRKRGWATNYEESEIGLRAVAMVVPAVDRIMMPAAITIAGPSFRMTDDRFSPIAEALATTVGRIAAGEGPAVPAREQAAAALVSRSG